MKIIIETPPDGEEDSVVFKCRELSEELLAVIKRLKSETRTDSLIFFDDGKIVRAETNDVYYFESVDEKVFACFSEAICPICEVRQKLYQLEEILPENFMRVSKSFIVNLDKIKFLSPALSGRFEATMQNGEKIVISRQYAIKLKRRFGL